MKKKNSNTLVQALLQARYIAYHNQKPAVVKEVEVGEEVGEEDAEAVVEEIDEEITEIQNQN
jgi:hypothetical protein